MFSTEKFSFVNDNGQQLSGRLELPAQPRAFAIFAHCFTCGKDARAATRVSRELAKNGIAVLRFDFTGLGNSSGDFANTNFSSNVQDLVSANEALSNSYQPPQLLIGHSLGGTASLLAASRLPNIRAVATIGAPAAPNHIKHLLQGSLDEIDSQDAATVKLGNREFTIQRQFIEDLDSVDMPTQLAGLEQAVLICHSPVDKIVDIRQAKLIYENLRHPKSFLALDGADHLLLKQRDSDFVASMLATWAERYLPVDDTSTGEQALKDGELLVNEIDGFTQEVRTNRHRILADEPISVGGKDLGMAPYDLLLAALGTCTSMTLRMYANHKSLPLDSISIRLSHHRIHAKDCANCESESGQISVINKSIVVSGDLTDAQVNRLKEIADRCPVHRTLMSEKKIETAIHHEVSVT